MGENEYYPLVEGKAISIEHDGPASERFLVRDEAAIEKVVI